MPAITSSDDLKNNYNEISAFCHSSSEPVFITQNGKIDLAVMSIEAYEELTSRFELYNTLNEGMEDIASSNTRSFSEVKTTKFILLQLRSAILCMLWVTLNYLKNPDTA